MTHEDYKELLTAKALTALDAEDARALDAHLESCADCRAEMSEWENTAAFLALDAKPLEPPARLREQILTSVRAEGTAGKAVSDRTVPIPSSVDAKVLAFERPRKNVWSSLRSVGAIAATILIAVLMVSVMMLWREKEATQQETARLATELRQARAELDHRRAVVALLSSPDAHMAKLSGTSVAPGAHAMLAYDKNGHAMLMAGGLPAAPQGMAYQLWYIKDNKKMPGKVFTPDASGNGTLEDQMPAVALANAVFAITLEPESGVQVPTGSIYLLSAS